MKTIAMTLSKSSVDNAIKQLRQYRASLDNKNDKFVERLAMSGIPVITEAIAFSQGDANTNIDKEIDIQKGDSPNSMKAVLRISGEDVLFFEFGSGIYHNKSDPPHASKFGYGVGTYPGQTHAFDPNGWWYRDSAGDLHHSYGQEATMPMLKASHEIIANIRRIAREVYGS